jgi:O-succinylbenzoic acid--CoA ligase
VDYPGITEGPVATNDLVEIGDSDDEFTWLGRIDHVINSGGVKIIPELLEQKIEKMIHLPCLVLPWPDARLGQKLVLVVENRGVELKEAQILDRLGKELHTYEVPKRLVQVEAIPRNASFKPDRREALKAISLPY